MYFEQINKHLQSLLALSRNTTESILFTAGEDGKLTASLMTGSIGLESMCMRNEDEVESVVNKLIEVRKRTIKASKQSTLERLQKEIDSLKLEMDYNEESV
jgi:Glu-tRNA(Gln) amidotransferase subunit E-like FAD-binding protein